MKYLIAALLLALAAMGLAYRNVLIERATVEVQLEQANTGLEQAATQRKLDMKVLVARQAQIASQARKLVAVNVALSEALQRNKSWSEATVPTEVIEAVTGRSGGPNVKAD